MFVYTDPHYFGDLDRYYNILGSQTRIEKLGPDQVQY